MSAPQSTTPGEEVSPVPDEASTGPTPASQQAEETTPSGQTSPQDPTPNQPTSGEGTRQSSASANEKKTFRKKLPPTREKIYPVHHRYTNPALLPSALRVHPKGFKILSAGSPIEKAMTTYFRLPPRAPPRIVEQQQKMESQVKTLLKEEQAMKKLLLDGFMIMDATQVQHPAQAKECVINNSNVTGAVPEDLAYFTHLSFLDLGENQLQLMDLAALANLEELHLHCNGMADLGEFPLPEQRDDDGEDPIQHEAGFGPLPRLHTLNLSFNQLRPSALNQLQALPSLARIDLSSNNLRRLPSNMSGLVNVRQLALENNKFSKPDVFLSLSTMPMLAELNLNHNELTCVPRISEAGFPSLETLGLASNKVEYFEDMYPLTQLQSLKCVVLYNNPIERRRKDKDILLYEFGNLDIQVVMEPPVPEKRKVGDFYSANVSSFVKVRDFKRVGKPKKRPAGAGVAEAPTASDDNLDGGTFFMTQTNAGQGAAGGGGGGGKQPASGGPTATAGDGVDDMNQQDGGLGLQGGDWSEVPEQDVSQGDTGMNYEARFAARGRGAYNASTSPEFQDPSAEGDYATYHQTPARAQASAMEQEASYDAADTSFLPDIHEPRGNLRSTLTELKRMLRQPLPPLSLSRFTSTGGRRQ